MLVTVSSKVSACVEQLDDTGASWLQRRPPGDGAIGRGPMLAHEPLEREDAGAAVLPGAGRAADRRERAGAVPDRGGDGPVGDDAAVADDHGGLPSAARSKAGLNYVRHT